MTLYAYTDGASRGNPGESGIGIILKDSTGKVVYTASGYIGTATNNSAEYQALIACLKKARETKCTRLILHSDSELMVRQLEGTYKVRDKNLRRYYQKAMELLKDAPFDFSIRHVVRDENREADLLANSGIDRRLRQRV